MALLEKTLRESLGSFDSEYLQGATVTAGEESVILSLEAPGANRVTGQVVADNGYDVYLDWLAPDGTTMRRETVDTSVSGGTWTDIDVPARGIEVDLVVAENSGLTSGDIIVDASGQMG